MMDQPYLSAFGEVLLFLIAGVIFVLVMLLVARFIRPDRPNPEKLSTYESGEEPISTAWTQFNIRFYVVALIFLLFEVELVFLFPWATIFADKSLLKETGGDWGWLTLAEMVVFIVILVLGLVYAWAKGHLDWVKPEPKVTDYRSPVPRSYYEAVNERFQTKKK